MTLVRGICKCNKSGEKFHTYGIDGMGSYGEMLMHTQNGDMAYWDIIRNEPVYQSLVTITDAFASELSLNRYEVFGLTRGVCCDPAADGSPYGRRPYCACCKHDDVSFFDLPEPVQHKEFSLPNVTHDRWNNL